MTSDSLSISVIIPVRDRSRTIGRCLESVLNQTSPPGEVVVVDDASTDETIKKIKEIDDPRVRLIRLPHSVGAQAARNIGIRGATGEWIAFLDSDDEWLPDKLCKQIKYLKEIGFDLWAVVHTDAWLFNQATQKISCLNIPILEGKNVFRALLKSRSPLFQGMILSKKALEKIGLLDELVPSHHEWDTALCLASFCNFHHIREPLFIYNVGSKDAISSEVKREIMGHKYIVDKHHKKILEECGLSTFDMHLRCCAIKAMKGRDFQYANEILNDLKGFSFKNFFLKILCKCNFIPGFL